MAFIRDLDDYSDDDLSQWPIQATWEPWQAHHFLISANQFLSEPAPSSTPTEQLDDESDGRSSNATYIESEGVSSRSSWQWISGPLPVPPPGMPPAFEWHELADQ